jgi:PRC-barrel domain
MAAFDRATLERWRALAIVDRDGATVGTVIEFYLDRETGHPTWALVNTGMFGTTHTFVPLVQATEISDGLQVPYEKRHIRDTPRVDPHDELTPDEEAVLFAHYGVDYQPSTDPIPTDPGAAGSSVTSEESAAPKSADSDPPEPGSAGSPAPPEPTRAGVDQPVSTYDKHLQDPPQAASDDPSRPAPVEPGLPGSTAAAPSGPTPPTIDEHNGAAPPGYEVGPEAPHPYETVDERRPAAQDPPTTEAADQRAPTLQDPPTTRAADQRPPTLQDPPPGDDHPAQVADTDAPLAAEAPQAPGEPAWPPGAAGTLEEAEPGERPTGATDRWREAKLAAERDRIAREAAQAEEPSPLERAKRRLERLMSGSQAPADADRDAAERASRRHLGLDDDDPRSR